MPGEDRQHDRNGEHEALRRQQDAAAVVIVGDRAGGEREHHHRQCGRGLDERDHVRRIGERGHQPGGADHLDEAAEVRDEACDPDRTEDRLAPRRENRIAARGRRQALGGEVGFGGLGCSLRGGLLRHVTVRACRRAMGSRAWPLSAIGIAKRPCTEPCRPKRRATPAAQPCQPLDSQADWLVAYQIIKYHFII